MEHRTMLKPAREDEHSFSGAAFPGAPEAVCDSYELFWNASHVTPGETAAQEREVALAATLLADFCDEYVSPQVYTAAMLSPIAEAATDPATHEQAIEALRLYANNPTELEADRYYAIGLASDRPVISNFWRENVNKRYADNPEIQQLLQHHESTDVSIEQWRAHAPTIEPRHINKLVSSVNLESLLIKATELLAQLDPATALNNSQTLARAHQAESLLAPLCEIIGFDALAMALYSHVHVLRAMFTGNLAPLQQAQAIIAERGDKERVNKDLETLFDVIFGDHIHEQIISHGAQHGIMMGEGYCTSECLRVNWRLKSIGSLTNKLDTRSPESIPLDIIGITVTTDDIPQIATRLRRIRERATSDERVTLTPTSSRDAAVHVKGPLSYIETIREGLGFESLEAMREVVDVVEVDEKAHHVCKVTLVFSQPGRPDLRAEVQITTKADRIENRIGQAAHMLYKLLSRLGSTDEQFDREVHAQDLALIHERKKHLSANRAELTSASINRARSLFSRLTSQAA